MYLRPVLLLLLVLSLASGIFAQTETPPELVTGNNQFAFDLYHAVETQPGNLFFAPFSVSQAFAMMQLGAGGTTADQIAGVMHYTLPDDQLHPAMQALNTDLMVRGSTVDESMREFAEQYMGVDFALQGPSLSIVNSLWGEQTFPFEESYLNRLTELYQAELHTTDFMTASEAARQEINTWISEATMERIPDAIPENMLTADTKFVLVNAVYFKNFWFDKFNVEATQDAPFTLLDGSTIMVPTMYTSINSGTYYAGDGYEMSEMDYEVGNFTMTVFVPDDFAAFEASFSPAVLQEALDNAGDEWFVDLSIPRFRVETTLELTETLKAMGMPAAFDSASADFTAISPSPLWIDEVLHKTFIAIDEFGTEAAGVTIVDGRGGGGPPDTVTIDINRPFIFLIRDRTTGTILFMGRVLVPEGGDELVPPVPTEMPG